MKKITFLSLLMTFFIWYANAQFTEGFDTEIPSSWTIINEDGGSYTWTQQTQYPQAGAGHARIHWEAAAHEDYLITPQFTVTAGVSDRISFYAGIDGTFWTETFDVRISTAGNTASDFTTTIASETATTDADGNYTQYSYDLSAYDGQSVYVAIVATDTDRFYLYIDEFVNDSQPADVLDYYNLQWPASGTISAGGVFDVYAQAYEGGLTDVSDTPAVGIEAWIGYSSANTDPSGTGWTWVTASPNASYDFTQNNDEYTIDLGGLISAAGTYYYASRWRLNGGAYTYGGFSNGAGDGAWDGVDDVSGVLTVTGPANDLFANAIALNCGDDITGTTVGATQDESGAPGVTTVETDTSADNDSPWVWYSYTGSGAAEGITLSTCGTTQTDFDTEIFVYTGTSGNLTLIDDGYDECGGSAENYAAETTFTSDGTTTYYIAIGGYDSDDIGNFHLAITCVTLSVAEFENANAFTYFPNPVKNTLSLNAQSNIQNVSIYNMLGQEVLRSAPNTLNSEVNMASLQTGAYFVKVTINDATETIRVIKQ